ncbi:simple sugar transport system ATP-binding protein [Paenibacillus forsythiae]|uniref:Simple sugar transport system ATP-binding protein n=1 Tax=Paenibacillus forsythiae TaxID=365616 RepID=A0ABU3H9T4_9BACL|nr:ABC transporter ATP-binding protein [Paenibacillus forsythiae]MDT3427583.1 simple sugar transport system ATP-binding protein [Paenibacillus forsythiae]
MTTVLETRQITKIYGDFTANDGIDFSLRKGEIHAIVGENGAGKTTLMRMLYGMESPTSGDIVRHGEVKRYQSPSDAIRNGVGMVFQHFMLIPSYTVAENIVIGNEPARGIWFDRRLAARRIKALCDTYQLHVDPEQKVSECSLGIRQRIEILKVLYNGADIIILDEPTAVLTPLEVKELLVTMKRLAKQGKSMILITHKLHEVMEVADRITVLRGGKVTGVLAASSTSTAEISRLMVGRELEGVTRQDHAAGEPVLRVRSLGVEGANGKALLKNITFDVCAGEIVGVAGVSGNGQSELVQVLNGLMKADQGRVLLGGTDVTNLSVRRIRAAGLAHIPEDRYLWGASKDASIKENAMMGHYRKEGYHRLGWLKHRKLNRLVSGWVESFAVKTTSIYEQAQHLSGGNLQKLISARELGQETECLIAAEPTRGVDLGAMELIHRQLLKKRERGEAVLVISSELSEIMTLSDRILVMFEGEIVGEIRGGSVTEEEIGLLMAGGERA